MRTFSLKIQGNKYNVRILAVKDEEVTVEVDGSEYRVGIEKKEQKTPTITMPRESATRISDVRRTAPPGESHASVKAPIPGVILKVNVKVGDLVKPEDTVVVMEAMKMQNDIHANRHGVVKEVSVTEGQSVLEGAPLLTIEVE